MYEHFTDRARKVIYLANQEAHRVNHSFVDTEHVVLGLIKEGSGVAAAALRNLGIDLAKLHAEVEKHVFMNTAPVDTQLPLTYRVKRAIDFAGSESRKLEHKYIGTEHILLGLLRLDEGILDFIFNNFDITFEAVREEVLNLLGFEVEKPKPTTEEPPADSVNHPSHYTRGGYECLDVIEALQLDYHLGNAFKYIWRTGHKNNAIEDVKKAIVYLNRWLELQEGK